MSTGLSFFLSLLATVGLFGGLYLVVVALIEGRRQKAKPRFGVWKGDKPGTLSFWMHWDPTQFNVQVYRIRLSHVSPENQEQEGMFSVSYEPAQKEPFVQLIELPSNFKKLVDSAKPDARTWITMEFKTVEGLSMSHEMTLGKFRKFYDGEKGAVPSTITNRLAVVPADVPSVMTLEFNELVERNKRLKTLEAAMKAKQAKAAATPPKPADAAPAAPKQAPSAPPAQSSGAPAPATPAAAAVTADKEAPKSVRDVVSAKKAKTASKAVES